jgi:hypothetical protein
MRAAQVDNRLRAAIDWEGFEAHVVRGLRTDFSPGCMVADDVFSR